MVFSKGRRGVSVLVPGAPAPPPSFLSLVSAGLVHIFSSLLFHSCCTVLLLFVKHAFPEMPPSWLRGSAVHCGDLAPGPLKPIQCIPGSSLQRPLLQLPSTASTWAPAPNPSIMNGKCSWENPQNYWLLLQIRD